MDNKKTLLIGPRGSGKTFFLLKLQRKLKKLSDALPIYIKLNKEFSSNLDWVKKLLRLIELDLERRGINSKSNFTSFLISKAAKTRNLTYLELLKNQIHQEYGYRIVFLIDDIDVLNPFDLQLLSFIDVASSSRVQDSRILNRFERVKLEPFSMEDYGCDFFENSENDPLFKFIWGDIVENFSGLPVYFTQTLSVISNLKATRVPIDRSIIKYLRLDMDYMANMYRIAESFYAYYKKNYGEKIVELMSISLNNRRIVGLEELINMRFKEFLDLGLIKLKKIDGVVRIEFVDKILLDWYKMTRYRVSLLSPQEVYRTR